MPSFELVASKSVLSEPKPIVTPQPFNLATEQRGQEAIARLQEKLKEEEKRFEESRLFKAQPMPIHEAPVCSHIWAILPSGFFCDYYFFTECSFA
jgi:hypothetical protein